MFAKLNIYVWVYKHQITFIHFEKFMSLFGPEKTVMVKLRSLINQSKAFGNWISFEQNQNAPTQGLRGYIDSKEFNAIVISLVSFLVALLGVDKIIAFSSPILNLLYPVSITIIVTTLLSKWLTNVKAIRLGVYTSLVFSLLLLIPGLNLSFLPLSKVGFGWVIPTILGIIIGYIIFKDKSVKNSDGKLAY